MYHSELIFLSDDGEWSSWSDWFCGCDHNVRTRARTCEDAIPASGPQCEPYISNMETEEQPGVCVRTVRMEGRNTKQKTFSTDATTHHKPAIVDLHLVQ